MKGEQEEHQSQFDERLRIEVTGSLAEFIGDDGGDGVTRGEKRGADGRQCCQ